MLVFRRDDAEGFHLTVLPVLEILNSLNGLIKFFVPIKHNRLAN